MPEKVPQLGKVQYRIMQVLWRFGKSTAREITDELSQERPIAHSTIQTLLRQLEGKGVVSHEMEERTFVFRPLCDQAHLTGTPLRELLQRVYRGSVVNLMSHLLKQEDVSADELRRLREMIDEEERK
jgi:BlaI family penicillinase repressor